MTNIGRLISVFIFPVSPRVVCESDKRLALTSVACYLWIQSFGCTHVSTRWWCTFIFGMQPFSRHHGYRGCHSLMSHDKQHFTVCFSLCPLSVKWSWCVSSHAASSCTPSLLLFSPLIFHDCLRNPSGMLWCCHHSCWLSGWFGHPSHRWIDAVVLLIFFRYISFFEVTKTQCWLLQLLWFQDLFLLRLCSWYWF